MTGVEALPRSNGELVFEEPWQARVFGLAVALVQEAGLDWEAFRSRLIVEIRASERRGADASTDAGGYYECWASALERLVLETEMVSTEELDERIRHVTAEDAHDGHHHHH
jgi:nitrile hydratase accessory protein